MIYSSLRLYLIQQNWFTYVYVFSLEDNDFCVFFVLKLSTIYIKSRLSHRHHHPMLFVFCCFSFSCKHYLYNCRCLHFIWSFCSISSGKRMSRPHNYSQIQITRKTLHFLSFVFSITSFDFSSDNRRWDSTGNIIIFFLFSSMFSVDFTKQQKIRSR